MDSDDCERMKRKGWSDLMVIAFERAAACTERDLGTLKASLLAQYVCLIDAQVTISLARERVPGAGLHWRIDDPL